MAVLIAVGADVPLPDALEPVNPEPPESESGPARPALEADPVWPTLLEVDPARVAPDPPEVASGAPLTTEGPPVPPPAAELATPEPPRTFTRPPGVSRETRLTAAPPPLDAEKATPAGPPLPPAETTSVWLAATPVSPDTASAADWAPLLADESTAALATAPPVEPEEPEALEPEVPEPPEVMGPLTAVAVPRGAELVAVGLDETAPVFPVGPESPATALGSAAAVDVATPVSPVFVLPDWAVEAPELPLLAVGLTVTVEAPPLPPFAVPVATPLPPLPVPVPTIWADAGPAAIATDSAAVANAAATAVRSRDAGVMDRADVLGSRVTFTSFAVAGKHATG